MFQWKDFSPFILVFFFLYRESLRSVHFSTDRLGKTLWMASYLKPGIPGVHGDMQSLLLAGGSYLFCGVLDQTAITE